MIKELYPGVIRGNIVAFPSKSYAIRAIICAALCNGKSEIRIRSICDDVEAALINIENLNAKYIYNKDSIIVLGKYCNELKNCIFNCKESGLCARIFAAISSKYNGEKIIIGEKSLKMRTIQHIENMLNTMNVKSNSNSGFLPLNIIGKLNTGEFNLDFNDGSQFLTGLLMALPTLKGETIINVSNLKSKPYVDLTIEILKQYNINVFHNNYKQFKISGIQKYEPINIDVEGDWSGAANFLIGAAISGKIRVSGLLMESTQADKEILNILKIVGTKIIYDSKNIIAIKESLKPFKYNAEHSPDLFPPLAGLAANCSGTSIIYGVNRLLNKESNRAFEICSILKSQGINTYIFNNCMYIEGGEILGGGEYTVNDHRIAMFISILAINAKKPIKINNCECVNKSYYNYWLDYDKCIIY